MARASPAHTRDRAHVLASVRHQRSSVDFGETIITTSAAKHKAKQEHATQQRAAHLTRVGVTRLAVLSLPSNVWQEGERERSGSATFPSTCDLQEGLDGALGLEGLDCSDLDEQSNRTNATRTQEVEALVRHVDARRRGVDGAEGEVLRRHPCGLRRDLPLPTRKKRAPILVRMLNSVDLPTFGSPARVSARAAAATRARPATDDACEHSLATAVRPRFTRARSTDPW